MADGCRLFPAQALDVANPRLRRSVVMSAIELDLALGSAFLVATLVAVCAAFDGADLEPEPVTYAMPACPFPDGSNLGRIWWREQNALGCP